MKVIITTAVEVSDKQKSTMESALQKQLAGQTPTFSYVVDPNVLGGVKLTLGSRELDGTIQARITQVKQQLNTQL